MLNNLQNKFEGVFKKLKNLHKITEANIAEGIKEIRLALLEADVNYNVVKNFEQKMMQKVLGEKVHDKVSPVDQFYTLVQEELLELLGNEESVALNLPKGRLGVVLLAGLQGSGKTTTTAKLANLLKADGNVLLVGADVYRPAAKEQLRILAESVGVDFFTEEHNDAVKIVKEALKHAKKNLYNVVLLDTAGRTHLDDVLMKELKQIKKISDPDEVLLVVDCMMGQNVVSVAEAFNDALDIDGVVLTKFDSDAKAGAALSIKQVTGKPIKYMGVGEKITDLEVFHPDRLVSRLLGRGDILTLIEKTQEVIEEDEAEKLTQKMMEGKIDLSDFLVQLRMMKKMGDFSNIMSMLPLPGNFKNIDASKASGEFSKMEVMILSMTKKERENYRIIDSSRKRRITRGSGTTLKDLTLFMDQFQKMGKMVKKFSKKAKLFGNLDLSSLNLKNSLDESNFNIDDIKKMLK